MPLDLIFYASTGSLVRFSLLMQLAKKMFGDQFLDTPKEYSGPSAIKPFSSDVSSDYSLQTQPACSSWLLTARFWWGLTSRCVRVYPWAFASHHFLLRNSLKMRHNSEIQSHLLFAMRYWAFKRLFMCAKMTSELHNTTLSVVCFCFFFSSFCFVRFSLLQFSSPPSGFSLFRVVTMINVKTTSRNWF